jgi:hypothetical protein
LKSGADISAALAASIELLSLIVDGSASRGAKSSTGFGRSGLSPRLDGNYALTGAPGELMDYQAFTNESLIMMYEGIRGALSSDDALEGLGEEPRFRVRKTPEWKRHAGNLESEMLKRGMVVNVIDWSEDQATLPFEEGS